MGEAMNPQPRILVMGAGSIGGIVAATLTEVGSAVTAVSTNALIRSAVDRAGFTVIDDAQVIVLQNGLCEERIAAVVGERRVIGAIVAWGASMPQPGRYERTAAGGFQVGRLSGALDDDLRRVGGLLEAIGPVTLTQNLRGARWSKLALNCAVSALGTIAGERLGPVVRVRRYRRLALEAMTECVQVARAEDV